MVLAYALTTFIVTLWIIKMIVKKTFIFKKSLLDVPLIVFLITQLISTIISLDTRTSLLGYYSRFHGGLFSSICYVLLYWAILANFKKMHVIKSINILLGSAFLVSLYAIAEHFGIDKSLWIQDVQNRVFSTLGQPNWLAAWIVALIPLTWALSVKSKSENLRFGLIRQVQMEWIYILLSLIFSITLIYTKSRSGYLGLIAAEIVFWGFSFMPKILSNRKKIKDLLHIFIIYHVSLLVIFSITGTPWTPSLRSIITGTTSPISTQTKAVIPALELGGSSSVDIRKIVWNGAINIWRHYPLFGSGVETFALSYYQFRPVEHNMVSEWDFLYNKAHNEYLNFLSTSGTVGFIAYFILIICSVLVLSNLHPLLFKKGFKHHSIISKNNPGLAHYEFDYFNIALLSGFASILVTNFFGFSVVCVALLFFIFPALAIAHQNDSSEDSTKAGSLSKIQLILISGVTLISLITASSIVRYWLADYNYAQGKLNSEYGNIVTGRKLLEKALKLSPNESLYWDELAQTDASIAQIFFQNQDIVNTKKFTDSAIKSSNKSILLNPNNVNILRTQAKVYIDLSVIDTNYLYKAGNILAQTIVMAPTEAKLFYNYAAILLKTNDMNKAIDILHKTIEMKPNYKNARHTLALILIEQNKKQEAKEQFEYIVKFIDSNDNQINEELEKLRAVEK